LEYEEEGKEKRGLVDVWGQKGKEIKIHNNLQVEKN
jgi:hypothetical protein